MTQDVVATEHNVVNPVSTDSDGVVISDRVGNKPMPIIGARFTPSSYDADLTMDGTAKTGALASGATAVQFGNLGATTEAIRVAFGTDAADADSNLTIVAGAATTGYYIPAVTQGGANAFVVLGASKLSTHYAVANAVALHTQVVTVTQGI